MPIHEVRKFGHATALSGPLSTSRTFKAQLTSGFTPSKFISFQSGMTIAEIAFQDFEIADGVVAEIWNGKDWELVPDHMWNSIRPKNSDVVRFANRLHGGKHGGQIFALVATIALTAIAGPGAGAAIGASLGVGTAVGSAILSAGIAFTVAYATSELFPVSLGGFSSAVEQQASSYENIESDSNVLPVRGYLPWVIGERRVTLPELMQPFAYLKDGRETLDRAFGWKDQHEIKDIEVDGTPIADFDLVQTEIRDGAASTPVETFIKRYAKAIRISQQFGKFTLDDTEIENQENPRKSEPKAIQFTTKYIKGLEEISIRMALSAFYKPNSETQKVAFPLRLWFRPKNTVVWNGICECHIIGRDAGNLLKDINLRWDGEFSDSSKSSLTYRLYSKVPAADNELSDSSTGLQFEAHEHFKSGDGFDATANIIATASGLRIALDESVFPKVEYEFKIETGLVTDDDAVNTAYEIDGVVHSLFRSYKDDDVWKVPVSQGNYPAQITVPLVHSIVAQQPVRQPGIGVLAMRSEQTVNRVTAVLGAMVNRHDGENFADLGESNNPADFEFAILEKVTRFRGVSNKVIDESTLSDWHKECAARDYRCSIIYNGQGFQEICQLIASAGFAKFIYEDGKYTVDYLRDRSLEIPKHTFSHRSTNLSIEVGVIKRPESFRVTFPDRSKNWKMTEYTVLSDFVSEYRGQTPIALNNIDREIDVLRRIHADDYSNQYQRDKTIVNGFMDAHETPVGTLIGIATDLIGDHTHGFRILEILDAKRIRVDQAIAPELVNDVYSEGNLFEIANMFNLGTKTVIYFNIYDSKNDPDGEKFYMDSRFITNVDGDILTLDSPMTTIDMGDGVPPLKLQPKLGSHVTITPEHNSRFRCLVAQNKRALDCQSTLRLVPEAPEILQKLSELN